MTWLVLAALLSTAPSPSARAETAASPAAKARLGEPVELQVRTEAGASMTPDLEQSATDFFRIMQAEPAKDQPGVWNLRVVPLALGKLTLPIYWKVDKGGKSEEARTDVALEVADPPMQGDDIADIKSPRAARPPLWPWLLALLAGALAYWLWTRYGRDEQDAAAVAEPADDRAPEEIAEAELADLAASGLWTERRYKDFYLRLTDCLRRYLERRYAMPATKLTSSELQRLMRHAELDRAVILSFRAVFDRADLVKFSKVEPEASWGERDLGQARELVRRTTPAPPPAPAQQPQGAAS